jgi:hypothetical protein
MANDDFRSSDSWTAASSRVHPTPTSTEHGRTGSDAASTAGSDHSGTVAFGQSAFEPGVARRAEPATPDRQRDRAARANATHVSSDEGDYGDFDEEELEEVEKLMRELDMTAGASSRPGDLGISDTVMEDIEPSVGEILDRLPSHNHSPRRPRKRLIGRKPTSGAAFENDAHPGPSTPYYGWDERGGQAPLSAEPTDQDDTLGWNPWLKKRGWSAFATHRGYGGDPHGGAGERPRKRPKPLQGLDAAAPPTDLEAAPGHDRQPASRVPGARESRRQYDKRNDRGLQPR